MWEWGCDLQTGGELNALSYTRGSSNETTLALSAPKLPFNKKKLNTLRLNIVNAALSLRV